MGHPPLLANRGLDQNLGLEQHSDIGCANIRISSLTHYATTQAPIHIFIILFSKNVIENVVLLVQSTHTA